VGNAGDLLVNVWRGEIVESRHYGHVAVVDNQGRLVYSIGNPEEVSYIRSAAKPIQAIPLVEGDGIEKFGLTERELAIFCASHSSERIHLETVGEILRKINLDGQALQCGAHAPRDKEMRHQLLLEGLKPEAIHNNCSGKHSGMLAYALLKGYDIEGYYLKDHPVQQDMLKVVSEMVAVDSVNIPIGIDGCGVSVFGMPVQNMALGYARLANTEGLGSKRAEAIGRIVRAMQNYPEMVAGTGRLSTELMSVLSGRIVAKSGAEGVFCVGIPEKSLGIAIKMTDGTSRGLGPVIMSVLDRLGILSNEDSKRLSHWSRPVVKNNRGEVVGYMSAAF